MQRLLNYYPNYSTRRLYFGAVETPYGGETREIIIALVISPWCLLSVQFIDVKLFSSVWKIV